MLEKNYCSRSEAIIVLRASLLFIIHAARLAADTVSSSNLVVVKTRSLTGDWRIVELLAEAIPGVKQVLLWRRIDNIVSTLDSEIRKSMFSPLTRTLHNRFASDGLLWRFTRGGGPRRFMEQRKLQ